MRGREGGKEGFTRGKRRRLKHQEGERDERDEREGSKGRGT